MKLNHFWTILFVLFVLSSTVYSQLNDIAIEIINGKEYYKYEVKAGEGLFAISKRFNVSQADINNINPHILDGIRAGQIIIIPKRAEIKAATKAVAATTATTQQPVGKSAPTTTVGKSAQTTVKEFLGHTVAPKQTLFAISRMYNISQDEIVKANPGIASKGINPGDILKIPIAKKETGASEKKDSATTTPSKPANDKAKVTSATKTVEEKKTAEEKKEKQDEKKETGNNNGTHKVQIFETFYSISKKYNVSVEDLKANNPQEAENLRVGAVLRIPQKKDSVAVKPKQTTATTTQQVKPTEKPSVSNKEVKQTKNEADDKAYISHKVKLFETIYSISKKYKVKVDDIKALNPESAESLKLGAVLRIPKANADSIVKETKPVKVEEKPVINKSTYKIAFLLPFMTHTPNDPTTLKFIEFYRGSLLAIKNHKNSEINFEIHAYDIEKNENKVMEVINKPEMKTMDLIIGPAYTSQIVAMNDFAYRNKIRTIIPFSSKVGSIEANPYLIQFNPDQSIQNDYLADIIRNKFSGNNILLIENGKNSSSNGDVSFFDVLANKLMLQKTNFSRVRIAESETIGQKLSDSKNNIIVFESENFVDVKDYLRELSTLSSTLSIAVIGQYAWRSERGAKPKMYYTAPFKGVKNGTSFYEEEYKKYYNKASVAGNPRFDLLGYDLTNFFFTTMKQNGFSFDNSTQSLRFSNGVQSDFDFNRVGNNGGFVNSKMYIIEDEATAN